VKLCADAIEQGVLNAVPNRVAQYASEQTWDRVVRHWRGRNCTEIAQLARAILTGKDKLHAGIGWQLCGMFLCVAQDRALSNCACFVDVVKSEGKERVNDLVKSAAKDWVNLHLLKPPDVRTAG
jgi:hypothetical protein